MPTYEIAPPFEYFTDSKGLPIDGGKIYIGVAGLEAETNPKPVYTDEALTVELPQPISTSGGYPFSGGAVRQIFTDGRYSITVRDDQNNLAYSALSRGDNGELIKFGEMISSPNLRIGEIVETPFGRFQIYPANTYTPGPTVFNATSGQAVSLSLVQTAPFYDDTRPIEFFRDMFGAAGNLRLTYANFDYDLDLTQAAAFHVTTAGGVELKTIPLYGPASVEYAVNSFGPIGTTNDDATIDVALGVVQGLPSGGTLVFPTNVTIVTPIVVTANRIKLKGLGLKSENENPVKITKGNGFAGVAAVIVGNGTDIVIGCEIENIYVNGANREGAGLQFTRTSNLVLKHVMTQANQGWGFIFDGTWITETYGCTSRFNGVDGLWSGGILLRCNNRQVSQFWGRDWTANQNFNRQMAWTVDDANVQHRPVGVYFYGGIFELPGDENNSAALVLIDGCDRSGFVNTHFAQEITVASPCVVIGSASTVHDVDELDFTSCYFQHNQTGPEYAIETRNNVNDVTFIAPKVNALNSKFIDATATTSGRIMVIGGDVEPEEYTDPNGVISSVGGSGVQMGLTPATAGGQLLVDPRRPSVALRLASRDAANAQHFIDVGAGTSRNLASFNSLYPRLNPQATAPADPIAGTLAISTGASGGFDGVSGEGLYRRNNANTAWVFVG